MTSHSKSVLRAPWRAALATAPCECPPGRGASLDWQPVEIPHNFEHYHGYARVSHGNLHGVAWYQCELPWDPAWTDREVFLQFEGVGSHADVWVNGRHTATHAGGRTCFTARLTPALQPGAAQLVEVRARHEEKIDDLPFACGGCWGAPNTEGSQPFGIFRPVHLEVTGPVRLEPFGTHIWTPEVSPESATVEVRAELRNHSDAESAVILRHELAAPDGRLLEALETSVTVPPGALVTDTRRFAPVASPRLWGPRDPALYRVRSIVLGPDRGEFHAETNRFGIRTFKWPRIRRPDADQNVCQPDPQRRVVDLGDAPPSPANNGHTTRLAGGEQAPFRVAPLGVMIRAHDVRNEAAQIAVELAVEAADGRPCAAEIELLNEGGTVFLERHTLPVPGGAGRRELRLVSGRLLLPHLWNPNDPYLYKAVITLLEPGGALSERTETTFRLAPGLEILNCGRPVFEETAPGAPSAHSAPGGQTAFLWNGEPVFHNGSAEYEHLLGKDHAFTDEQIAAEVAMFRAAGFNAFRDAHHPHNLRYYDLLDEAGLLCWTQIGSHIYFDTKVFRDNYRAIVREWVRERRNHPCIAIWGLQNESLLPEWFARELRGIIMELDPSCPSERITTTCNGGRGSDWNVPQEWSGTYGGNCNNYNLAEYQLVGEYGAWRKIRKHTGAAYRGDENDHSETYADCLLETKIRRASEQRHLAVGHYHWVFNTFQNPGRSTECTEGDGNDAIGPVNNKGLFTAWREPSDSFFLYRANFAPKETDPMVYIVSHTWPGRFANGPARATLRVYSNCDEVALFNGFGSNPLGLRANPGTGRHFQWEDAPVRFNLLHAVGYVNGRPVAADAILLDGLPPAPGLEGLYRGRRDTTAPPAGAAGPALFRVNCGGPDYRDHHGQLWAADRDWQDGAEWGCLSWGRLFDTVPDDIASKGRICTPVDGTLDEPLYQTFRYGREFLEYRFAVPPGGFLVQLHFAEPWYGAGGGRAEGWRLFDVAVNGVTVLASLDLWRLTGGPSRAWTHTARAAAKDGLLRVHFPRVAANQAVIQAIAVFPAKE